LRGRDLKPFKMNDLSQRSTVELIGLLKHPNKWHRQTVLRILGDRRETSSLPLLKKMLAESSGLNALNALWAINLTDGLDETFAQQTLRHHEPLVREWTVRLLGDRKLVGETTAQQLASLAAKEEDVHVRSQLAASARRFPAGQGLPIVAALLTHDEDQDDIHIPLLLWWAIEENCQSDADLVLKMFSDVELWQRPIVQEHLLERVMRRFASSGRRDDLLKCAELLNLSPATEQNQLLLAGFEKAFEGRSLSGLPDELLSALSRIGGGSLALRLRQGNPNAIAEATDIVQDPKASPSRRADLIRIFGDIRDPSILPMLLKMSIREKDNSVQAAVLSTLQSYSEPKIAESIVAGLPDYIEPVREVALSTLASRAAWSHELLDAVENGQIDKDTIPASVLRTMLLHQNDSLSERIANRWGSVSGASTAKMVAESNRITELLDRGSGNPYVGKVLYLDNCGKCHQLFEDGGQIGPSLTAYKRDDVRQLLVNVINPSLEIREGYENMMVLTLDGRVINGFVEDQDNQVVVIKGSDGQRNVIEKENIDLMQASKNSLMPEELLEPLSDQQLRDLFAYLRSTQPLP